jgi:hypothetical protein
MKFNLNYVMFSGDHPRKKGDRILHALSLFLLNYKKIIMFLGSKVRPVRRAYCHLWADCPDNVGSLTSHNPIDLQDLLEG